ncbi:MAG: ABC transporter ATP-binding protein [Fibrobacterota bacterium]
METFLEIKGLCRAFGGLRAVDNVSFDVTTGVIQAVIGPNGAGKTTLFNCVAGSLRPDSGSVSFCGRDITGQPPHRIARAGISRTFQNIRLFSNMTVLENVLVGLHTRGCAGFLAGMLRLPSAKREEKQLRAQGESVVKELGLSEIRDRPCAGLSFGEQRGVELARAVVSRPKLLLLDEPAAGLNMHETHALANRIKSIRDSGITVLLVEHDMSLVMDISERIVVLASGRKIADGTPKDIQANPEVVRVYLGDDDA